MKYAEIFEIKNALTALGKEKLAVAYEVAKNIRICDKVLTETQEIAKELHTKFTDKDEKGEVKIYKDEEGRDITKISDAKLLAQYQEELKKLDSENHEITFIKINKAKLEAEKLSADMLIALIDTVIVAE